MTDLRCKVSEAILRDGPFELNYALNVNCLRCKACKEWILSLTILETMMVYAIEVLKEGLEGVLGRKEELREVALSQIWDATKGTLEDDVCNFFEVLLIRRNFFCLYHYN